MGKNTGGTNQGGETVVLVIKVIFFSLLLVGSIVMIIWLYKRFQISMDFIHAVDHLMGKITGGYTSPLLSAAMAFAILLGVAIASLGALFLCFQHIIPKRVGYWLLAGGIALAGPSMFYICAAVLYSITFGSL